MKILVALDGSEAAFNAFRTSCDIAARSGATIMAFYVNKGEEYTAEETGWIEITEKIADELESLGHRVINTSYEIGRAGGAAVEGVISYGVPAAEILNYVYDHGIIKLIATGHSSKGKGTQEFVDSTTRAVVAYAKAPVLVTSSVVQIKDIVLAVDESGPAEKAAAFAGVLAKSLEADLRILAVVPDAETIITEYRQVAEVPGIWRYIDASQKSYDKMAERASSAARDILASMDIHPETIIRRGQPADEILAEVKSRELLVIGLRSGPSGKKIGPVAHKLLNSHSTTTIFV